MEKRKALHKTLRETKDKNQHLNSQLAQLQALANIGTSTCMIAHEMNNVLAPMVSYAQLALNNPQDHALAQKALTKTASNATRAARILDSMLALAGGRQEEKKVCRVAMMIEDVFTCLCRDFKKDRITVDLDIPADLCVSVVAVQMQQVFMNLIINARDAMTPKGGKLRIVARPDQQNVSITFTDTGSGISPENIGKIFDAFFSTKTRTGENKSGAGLGLAFCKKIVNAHQGSITVTSQPEQGTTFTVTLPV
ncbi:MAG: hypothetical protein A2178_01395 [Planctomycetes bacterium GWC2_49_10]|nr:MAG: hypothetical protein A2178_01395 [Planctomycetes bacterium GWC2_49_10]